jgi:hypothetical protein
MSTVTTPEQQLQQRIIAAVDKFQKTLASKCVQLDDGDNNNVSQLAFYIQKHKLNFANEADLMQAFNALWPKNLLTFKPGFEPAPLRKKKVAPLPDSLQAKVEVGKATEAREKAARAQEAKEASDKKEADAEKDVEGVIAAFQLTKGGSIRYAATLDYQKAMRDGVLNLRAKGHTFVQILPIVQGWVSTRYQEWYAEQERM